MPVTKDYWPLVLESLKSLVTDSNYRAWFSALNFVSITNQGRKLVLGVPSKFNKNYIESKYKNELSTAISKYYPQVIHIEFTIDESLLPITEKNKQPIIEDRNSKSDDVIQKIGLTSQLKTQYLPSKNLNNLNPRYTFENFVITSNNRLAANVALSVVNGNNSYNPVFIYGGVGLGKTHILQAVGHKFLEKNPALNIKYIPAETFINQYIVSIQKKETDKFREYYRNIDLLLIDDIQFMAGKEATQEAFFHTFNELHQQNKQIFITSDKPAGQIPGIEERLVSRFNSGMVIDIPKPDFEDRIAILKEKTEKLNLDLPIEIIEKIATTIATNVRELEGVLNKIQARINLLPGQDFTSTELDQILNHFNPNIKITSNYSDSGQPASPNKIFDLVLEYFSVDKTDLLSDSRLKSIVIARQTAMWLFKFELNYSYPSIGKMFGGRDHTTAMHTCTKISKLAQKDQQFKQKLDLIIQTIRK